MNLSKAANNISIPNLEEYFKGGSKNLINLSIGEPDFDLNAKVKKKLFKLPKTRLKYSSPKGNPALRMQIADTINMSYGTKYTDNNTLITTGSSYSLFVIFQSILDSDDEIIIFEPYFPPYIELAKIVGAKPKIVNSGDRFVPDISDIEKIISPKTKAILLNSPNNPTGIVYSDEFLESIAKLAKKNDLFIISDEVYKDFDYDKKFSSPAEFYYKTIIVDSFSKSHAATGLRIGYICAPTEIIDAASQFLFLEQVCVANFIQSAFLDNLERPNDQVQIYRENRDMVVHELSARFNLISPDGGFYLFLKAPCDEKEFLKALIKNGVLAMPGSIFSSKQNYFRISLISNKTKLAQAINIINTTYDQISTHK
ncbi:pyridoxal phosphate-dependent aminotransferase [Patescibacteria group bacterium]|nr:pyridoxal phosphate-dependent aminotransferase [Patescibacteria group bacterium]